MPHILISNDDGVYAEGINVLAKAVEELADVTIVAPDRNRSGASNSLTINSPLHIKNMKKNVYSVEGTPTDCVHLANTGLLEHKPDMVLSGINHGANVSDDVWYSGTVAAAMEGRFLGLPAIAFSLQGDMPKYFETAKKIANQLVKRVLEVPLPKGTFLNVNIPDVSFDDIQGWAVTRLGTRHCAEPTIKSTDPRGHPIYWVGPPGAQADAGPGTDFYALEKRMISITPLRIDLTNYDLMDSLERWLKQE